MNEATTKAIIVASIFLAIGLVSALIVSGDWLMAVGALGGWAVGLWLMRATTDSEPQKAAL